MIRVDQIRKTYNEGAVVAVDNVSFNVENGELFGLIGPDGAGKTSLFRMLTTLMLPDGGSATVNGMDIVRDFAGIRKSVGYMPGKFSLYQDLTIEENLRFFATIFGTTVKENYHLIEDIYVQIEPFKKRRAGALSGGMKQKLALCCALIHKPVVLFLDEPTTGVDVVSRREFWEMLGRLKQQGITILVSTPYMDEARRCDRIALIQEGKIMSINTPEQVEQNFGGAMYMLRSRNMYKLLKDLRTSPAVDSCFAFGDSLHVTLQSDATLEKLKQFLSESGHADAVVQLAQPSIEDCFIKLMHQ
jgi:ABC-type multidrug transport system ATPase subunit